MDLNWEKLWAEHSDTILAYGKKGLIVVAALLVCHFLSKAVHRWIHKTNDKFERFDATLVPTLCAGGTVSVYAVGLVVVLDAFGVNTTSLVTLIGAAGLAIALALKDTLSNIAAGITLLILRPFKTGHSIECGSILGKVKEVGMFTTKLETPDGLFISAPNSSLWTSPIKNFTRNGKRRMDLIVGISYDDSIDKGFEALQNVIKNESRFLAEPAPQVMVQAMADSSVNLQLRAWASVDDFWNVQWDSNKRIKEEIEALGLTIPFPQTDVHIIREKGQ